MQIEGGREPDSSLTTVFSKVRFFLRRKGLLEYTEYVYLHSFLVVLLSGTIIYSLPVFIVFDVHYVFGCSPLAT